MSSVQRQRDAAMNLSTLSGKKPRNARVSSASTSVSDESNDRVEIRPAGPIGIDQLRAPESAGGAGLTSADIIRLVENGYATVESIAFTPLRRILSTVKCIGEQRGERLKIAAAKMVPMGFQSAAEYLEQRQQMIRLSTGSNNLDAILRGGVETGSITEIIGEFRTGKTQFCHTLCVTSQLPVERGGAAGKIMYIDSEGTFRPERVLEISKRFSMDPNAVLGNIVYARAYNSEHQYRLLLEAGAVLAGGLRFAVIIVDSATSLFRTDFMGRGELAERQQMLARFLRTLQRLADEYGCAVVITNQVIANVDMQHMMFAGPTSKPAGGHVIAHASQTRLFFRKGQGNKRTCKVYDSPSLPDSEAQFVLSSAGISDEEDLTKANKRSIKQRNNSSDSDED